MRVRDGRILVIWDYSVDSYSGIRITEHTEYQFPKEQTLCYYENRTKIKAMRPRKSGYTRPLVSMFLRLCDLLKRVVSIFVLEIPLNLSVFEPYAGTGGATLKAPLAGNFTAKQSPSKTACVWREFP